MESTRMAVVTGATSGIGLATLKTLLAGGWACLAVGRSQLRTEAANREVMAAVPGARVQWLEADLSSIGQTRSLAAAIRERLQAAWAVVDATPHLFPAGTEQAGMPDLPESALSVNAPLDALVLCAGCVTDWYLATEDGYETQFAVNHLSQFLLAHALRANLQAARGGRIITISSGSHANTRIRWGDIMLRRHYNPLLAYKQSKLCNVLFAAEWNRRHAASARALAVDPGLVRTEIGLKGTAGIVRAVWKWRMRSGVPAEHPAAHVAELLAYPGNLVRESLYWKDGRPARESGAARDPVVAERLWHLSERLCGV